MDFIIREIIQIDFTTVSSAIYNYTEMS